MKTITVKSRIVATKLIHSIPGDAGMVLEAKLFPVSHGFYAWKCDIGRDQLPALPSTSLPDAIKDILALGWCITL